MNARLLAADRTTGALLAIALIVIAAAPVLAQQPVLSLNLPDRIRITERTNLSLREEDRYVGLKNRQVVAYLTRVTASATPLFSGRVLVYERTLRDMSEVGRPVDASYATALEIDPYSTFVRDQPDPPFTGIPTFPRDSVTPGDTWTAPGRLVVRLPSGADPVRLDVMVAYRYEGREPFDGGLAHRITAAFATRYPPRPDPDAAPGAGPPLRADILRIAGRHEMTIMVPTAGSAPLFIREAIEEQYQLAGEPAASVQGHRLLFVQGLSTGTQRELAQEVETALRESAAQDVGVEATDVGTRLTVRNLRFVADEATILPDERPRLNQIADALEPLIGVRFLVVGHTADTGNPTGERSLSLARARVVVEELTRRGLDPARFDIEGRGGTEPVAPNDTESGRALNRRVEIYILEE